MWRLPRGCERRLGRRGPAHLEEVAEQDALDADAGAADVGEGGRAGEEVRDRELAGDERAEDGEEEDRHGGDGGAKEAADGGRELERGAEGEDLLAGRDERGAEARAEASVVEEVGGFHQEALTDKEDQRGCHCYQKQYRDEVEHALPRECGEDARRGRCKIWSKQNGIIRINERDTCVDICQSIGRCVRKRDCQVVSNVSGVIQNRRDVTSVHYTLWRLHQAYIADWAIFRKI